MTVALAEILLLAHGHKSGLTVATLTKALILTAGHHDVHVWR